jgi:hypothetical protein
MAPTRKLTNEEYPFIIFTQSVYKLNLFQTQMLFLGDRELKNTTFISFISLQFLSKM